MQRACQARQVEHIRSYRFLVGVRSIVSLYGGSLQLYYNDGWGTASQVTPVGFELATNGIQFYVIANLEKT